MSTILLRAIRQLETQLANLSPHSQVNVSLTANSLGELSETHRLAFCKAIVYPPFAKSPEQNFYYYEYTHPTRSNILIRIKSEPIPQKNG